MLTIISYLERILIFRQILVSDSYHTFRLRQISDEVGLEATVAPTSGKAGFSHLMRETVAAGLGRIFGYRRLDAR